MEHSSSDQLRVGSISAARTHVAIKFPQRHIIIVTSEKFANHRRLIINIRRMLTVLLYIGTNYITTKLAGKYVEMSAAKYPQNTHIRTDTTEFKMHLRLREFENVLS